MTGKLAKQKCVPCTGGATPLKGAALEDLLRRLGNDWQVVGEHHLEKTFKFGSYEEAVDFTNRVAEIAEEENHHPDILLTYGKVGITIWTHRIDGLTESDFVFAAKAQEAADAL